MTVFSSKQAGVGARTLYWLLEAFNYDCFFPKEITAVFPLQGKTMVKKAFGGPKETSL